VYTVAESHRQEVIPRMSQITDALRELEAALVAITGYHPRPALPALEKRRCTCGWVYYATQHAAERCPRCASRRFDVLKVVR